MPFWPFWDVLKNPRSPPGSNLRLPLSRKPSIIERNRARFRPRGNMQHDKTHFGHSETFVTKNLYYHSPETLIADISKTVNRRAKRSLISTHGHMQLPKTDFGRFETFLKKIPYYHSPETLIADISKTVDRRAKRSSILTPRAYATAQNPFWPFWDVRQENPLLSCFQKSKMATRL